MTSILDPKEIRAKILKATVEDIPAISALWVEMVKELAPTYTPNREWWSSMCKNFCASGSYHLFVAEYESSVIGFIDFFAWPEPSTGKIHAVGQHFYLLPVYRKTAIAGSLYKRAVKEAKKQNCSCIELCCFETEKPFWERKGYSPVRSMVRRQLYV